MDAMFWALGRGRVLNDQVINVRLPHLPQSVPMFPAECMRPSDPGIKWRLCVSLYYTSRHPSLLPFCKSLHQDTMGQIDTSSRVHAFYESHFGIV